MQFSDVTDLPGPPLLERFFLVAPIPTAAAVFLVGLLLFEILRRNAKPRTATIAFLIGAAGAAAIVLTGFSVVTPYERARQATERFVERASAGDRDAVEDMLAGRFELVLAEGGTARSADWMLDRIELLGRLVVSNQQVWRGGEAHRSNRIRTRMTLRTQVALGSASERHPSTWDFVWQRDAAGDWRLARLEAISLIGQKPWRGWGDNIPAPMGYPR